MNGLVDLGSSLGGLDLKSIVLNLVFLTVPGLALAKGLQRFRVPAGTDEMGFGGEAGRRGRAKAHMQQLGGQLASFVTIVALLTAGLGLVPLVRAVYELVSRVDPAAPAVIGVIVVAALLVKGFVMARDLMDSKVDRPQLWLAPVPLLALLIWVAPVVADQITDQAGQTVRMIVDEAKADGQARDSEHPSGKDEPDTGKPDTGKPGKEEPDEDDDAQGGAGSGEQDR
ncbi:hypothetical protein Acsp03_71960 [Actinomadura sp. NBRC 104412]|uniref:hypothetical protein n=1 Tax=Actinomadura sp. NBRC 104412 TaxID=3032203 RepID=UPI0024A5BCD8|nr:hypothetical protein [Actinomadura sp. NBRC 104412]GLZ09730.1 hypothetical protein Acsp03_71960 [Actinomadura sp. NBRC 104412]